MSKSILYCLSALIVFLSLSMMPTASSAQGVSQSIYSDSLQNGWENWGWATLDYANSAPVHGGTSSIAVTAGAYQAMFIHHSVQDSYQFAGISFWINGGAVGGQALQVVGLVNDVSQPAVSIPALKANTWQHVTVDLASLGVAGKPDLDGFWIMDRSGTAQPTFYVDDVSLTPATVAPPTSAKLSVDAASSLRSFDDRLFGVNTAVWDSNLTTPATSTLLGGMHAHALRFPGGSTSDGYDWSKNLSDGSSTPWAADTGQLADLAASTLSQAYVTVNYGSGTPQMAAAWVAWANASTSSTASIGIDSKGRDWKTAGYWSGLRAASPLTVDDGFNFLRRNHASPYGLRYWEVGNETYGGWENDQHGVAGSGLSGVAHDPITYASGVLAFSQAMKSVDPTVKIGVVVVNGEDAYPGTLAVTNPNENNAVHNGWTPELLTTLHALGVTPSFLSYHRYPESPWVEDDYALLQSATGWGADATGLRKMLTDYLGAAGSNVELAATEAGSVSSTPGKQSTSLVDGLFYADSAGTIAESEINANIWWDLRNGAEANNNNSATLFGWRNFGDYGMVADGDRSDTPLNTPYPVYYGAKLAALWASAGDTVLTSSTDYARLTVHAVRKANGHVSLLVVNKSPSSAITGHIVLNGFTGTGSAAVHSYGKANDTGKTDLTTSTVAVSGSTLDYAFPSYSMTVIDLPYGHTVPKGVRMISAPFDYTGTPIASLLGAGAKLYSWDPALLFYIGTPNAPDDTLHLGSAYWVKQTADVVVSVAGVPAPAGAPYKISLKHGWNMIGNPFATPVTIGTLQVDTPTPSTPKPIASSPLVSLPLYAYNGTSYTPKTVADTLDPYAGYWIYATGASTLIVSTP